MAINKNASVLFSMLRQDLMLSVKFYKEVNS